MSYSNVPSLYSANGSRNIAVPVPFTYTLHTFTGTSRSLFAKYLDYQSTTEQNVTKVKARRMQL
jgi:hypothetical protein